MKKELIKVIAEYLGSETKPISKRGEYFVEFETPVKSGKTRHDYCQEIAAEITEKVLPILGEKDYPLKELFDHMANEHGLTLLDTELDDIIHIARGK